MNQKLGRVKHLIHKNKRKQHSQLKNPVFIAIILLIFVVISILQFQIDHQLLRDVMLQSQVILAVYFVISEIKHGYFLSLLISFFSIILSFVYFNSGDKEQLFHAMITYVTTIVISSLINIYRVKLVKALESTINHHKKTTVLVKELRKKNKKLAKLNKILKEKEKQLSQLAFYDILTEIPNRKMLINQMDFLINIPKNFSVVFIDLDNFKKINDTMGHQMGDSLLKEVTLRVRDYIHSEDMLGRLGGDEFALIIQRNLEDEEILNYVEELRQLLMEPFTLKKTEISISASFGVSVYPKDGNTSSELLKFSDIAMYQAKDMGKNSVEFFTMSMNDEIVKNLEYEYQLKKALENQEFYLLFQPQYCAVTKRLHGFEALVRWDSPKYGIVNPKNFIPLAEKLDYIIPLGEWILKTACQTLRNLQDTLEVAPIMSINISKKQLKDSSFFDTVTKIIRDTGVNPQYLEFDLEETAFQALKPSIIEVIQKLKDIGIKIAMDNFGTGISSLCCLQSLPFNTVKIDKTLIDVISEKSEKKEIIRSFIALMHQLDLMVVAEGVETEEQLACLCESSCDTIQGYIWGNPMEEGQILRLGKQWKSSMMIEQK